MAFRVAKGNIQIDPLRLADRDHGFEVTGAVDFSRRLDLRVRSLPLPHGTEADAWGVAGTLDAPQVTRQTSFAGTAAGTRR